MALDAANRPVGASLRNTRPAVCHWCRANTTSSEPTPPPVPTGHGWIVADVTDGKPRWIVLCDTHHSDYRGATPQTELRFKSRHERPHPQTSICASCEATITPFDGFPVVSPEASVGVQVCSTCLPSIPLLEPADQRREQIAELGISTVALTIDDGDDLWELQIEPVTYTVEPSGADTLAKITLAAFSGKPDPIVEFRRAVRAGALLWRRRNKLSVPGGNPTRSGWRPGRFERVNSCCGDLAGEEAWKHCHSARHIATLFGVSNPRLIVQVAVAIERDPDVRPLAWE